MIRNRITCMGGQQPFNIESTFTRSGVAYDKNGNSVPENTPRFRMFGTEDNGLLIEEATINILTSGASQNIAHDTPYTTGTLNGTYTFSCRTGNLVLSGGATGTVTPSAPLTKTISDATVTLTPDVSATFNQVEELDHNTSWMLGGCTREVENFRIPVNTFNNVEGTIECEGFITHNFCYTSPKWGSTRLFFMLCDDEWSTNVLTYAICNINFIPYIGQWVKIGVTWDATSIETYINGNLYCEKEGWTSINPKYFNIGSGWHTLYNISSTMIRNVVVSKVKRSASEIASRASSNFPLDSFVTAKGELTSHAGFKALARV